MDQMSSVDHVIFIQQGSSQTLRVYNEALWMVLDEAWGGYKNRQLYSTTCRASFPGTPEGKAQAEAEAKRIRDQKDY